MRLTLVRDDGDIEEEARSVILQERRIYGLTCCHVEALGFEVACRLGGIRFYHQRHMRQRVLRRVKLICEKTRSTGHPYTKFARHRQV